MWLPIVATAASASVCPPTPLPFLLDGAADAFAVTLVEEQVGTLFPTVSATVDAVYGGCASPGETVELVFSPDDDARPAYALGGRYVVTTSEAIGAQRTVPACGLFLPPDALSGADVAWLETRPVVCGGVTTCQDGAVPAACEDRCAATECPGAACATNPCAACAVELLDPAGEPIGDADGDDVCDPADDCPGADDRADADADGVCDDLDACPEGDDGNDGDANGVPDACDPPPAHTGAPAPGTDALLAPSLGGSGGCRCDGTGGGAWFAGLLAVAVARRRG